MSGGLLVSKSLHTPESSKEFVTKSYEFYLIKTSGSRIRMRSSSIGLCFKPILRLTSGIISFIASHLETIRALRKAIPHEIPLVKVLFEEYKHSQKQIHQLQG